MLTSYKATKSKLDLQKFSTSSRTFPCTAKSAQSMLQKSPKRMLSPAIHQISAMGMLWEFYCSCQEQKHKNQSIFHQIQVI